MSEDPNPGREVVATNGMHLHIQQVDFEVHPVEAECLDERQRLLPEDCITGEDGEAVLIEDCEDGIAENQRDCVVSLHAVLDVEGWVEFEVFGEAPHEAGETFRGL